jgi:endonuclease YncB( thermonuclease family)
VAIALAVAFSMSPIYGPATAARSIVGVAHVVDGDTISIGETRIRLEGIDAPEAGQTCKRKWIGYWSCGSAATNALAALIESKTVTCEGRGLDKYGRTLAVCFVDGEDVNARMVRQGYAWAFVKYSASYVKEEMEAKAKSLGIWQGDAVPAWEYRHQRWTTVERQAPSGCAIKGNITKHGKIYHMPWSPWYDQIKVEPAKGKRWFCTEAEALAAGWRPVQVH